MSPISRNAARTPSGTALVAPPPARTPFSDPGELERSVESLTAISRNLLESYGELARRAERMESELCRANAELEDKVAELDRVKRHLEAILQALPTGVVVRDARGAIARVNDAAQQILGSPAEELLGREMHPGLQGEGAIGEPREWLRRDGERRVVASRFSAIGASDVEPHAGAAQAGSVEILDDRTEITELGERLHGLDKLAALGNMAAGIAHEIRNPLNGALGFAALLQRRLPAGSTERRWAGRIVEGAEEANAILGSMLTLARPERLVLETVDCAELLRDAVAGARTSRPEETADSPWEIECSTDAPPFVGDRIKLRQAVRNLIANALQAQPDGGRVHVALERDGDDVVVRVDDAGAGIAPELRRRVLEPFFTTRARGTGLGLSLVHTIARLHGGRVEVLPEPSPLGGASLALRIPAGGPDAPAADSPSIS